MLARLKQFFDSRGGPAYLVGGYLRDSILSRTPRQDIDITLAEYSPSAGRALAQSLQGSFVALRPDQGLARVVVKDSDSGQWRIDLATFSGSIEEDLARRDFTVNAMALPLAGWDSPVNGDQVIDPFNGRQDLFQKTIRAVGPDVFQDDPGRLLRAVRLAASLGFRLEPETTRQVLAGAPQLDRVPRERVRDEFLTILAQDGAKGSLEVLDRLDLLCRIIPELAHTKGVEQPKVHYWDVWQHLLHTVEYAEKITKGHQHSPVYTLVYWTAETEAYFSQHAFDGQNGQTMLKLAALLHDIAKPQTKQKDKTGRTRFPGHSEMGAAMATSRLRELRLESGAISWVARIVEHHLRPGHMMQGVERPTGRAAYRYFRDVGDVAIATLYLSQADFLAAKGPELNPDDWAHHARMVAYLLDEHFHPPETTANNPLVNGRELMDHFGLKPGPVIGAMLEIINEARATGEIASREEALAVAAESLRQQREEQ